MKGIKESLGDWISAGYALTTPLRKPAGCRVLMYHAVGGDVGGDYQGLYSVAPARFSAHMRSLSELFSANVIAYDAGVASGDGIAITFDDGYRDNLTAAVVGRLVDQRACVGGIGVNRVLGQSQIDPVIGVKLV